MAGKPGGCDGKRAKKGSSLKERVLLHVDQLSTGCWKWTAATDKSTGYGRIQYDGTIGYAHRASYEVHVGPIPTGTEIDHLCRNRWCVAPSHLEAVTPQVNVRRGESPGARALRRARCLYGHPYEEHGVVRGGRRVCRLCCLTYSRLYRATPYVEIQRRKKAGAKVVDLGAYFSERQVAA